MDISSVANTPDEKATSLDGADHAVLIQGPVTLKRGWRRKNHHFFLHSDTLLVSNSKYVYMICSPDYTKVHMISDKSSFHANMVFGFYVF